MLGDVGPKEQVRNLALGLFGRLSRPFARRRPSQEGESGRQSILLVRPDHLGDLLFITPALTLLRRARPNAKISCLVGPWGREVLQGNSDVDEVLTCDFPWFNRRPKRSALEPYAVLKKAAEQVAGQGFDVAVNLRSDFWWGALLAYVAGVPEIVGYDRAGCSPFLTTALPYLPRCHEVEQNLRLIGALVDKGSALVREARSYPLRYHPSEMDEAYVDRLLGEGSISGQSVLVAIHPGAGAPVKLWTVDGFGEVARKLMWRCDGYVVITGSAQEREMGEEIAERLDRRRVTLVAGQTSLGQLAALFRRCSVVIGVDSGPLHLAVAMGTPTVHLFGPSDPAAFGPYGDRSKHAIVSAGLECSPCGRLDIKPDELPLHTCMLAIEPKQVVEAVEQVLERRER